MAGSFTVFNVKYLFSLGQVLHSHRHSAGATGYYPIRTVLLTVFNVGSYFLKLPPAAPC